MNRKNLDGSFNIIVNGLPYNTMKGDKYFQETENLFKSNPELFEIEEKTIEKVPSYQELRIAEYGTIGDQLDMIYWDKVNGTNKWVDKITEIKNKYPKQ